MQATLFLSCDWGTSAFRLKLVTLPELAVLAQEESEQGNAATFEAWSQARQPADQRFAFYRTVIQEHIKKLEAQLSISLDDVPLVISGMASSTIGMAELPYKDLPFATDGSDLTTHVYPSGTDFQHPTLLISGVKTEDDVMRGEETQLVGCLFDTTEEEQLFLHPGTHAKHVAVKNGQVTSLTTYMTGELFSLLSSKSILAASVEKSKDLQRPGNRQSFEFGVRNSLKINLLHALFTVRTNDIFHKLTRQENYFYLSGLVIGSELRDFPPDYAGRIMLAGEPALLVLYEAALEVVGVAGRATVVTKSAEEVTLRGQAEVLKRAGQAGKL